MNQLERRYRRVLRLLPADYRAVWEEDMVDTFLAGVEPADPEEAEFVADYGRPGAAEVVSVVGLAVRLRLGGTGAVPTAFARGEAVRRVALVGLVVHASTAGAGIAAQLWSPLRFPGFVPTRLEAGWALAELVWVAAFVALVLGARRGAVWAAGLGLGVVAVGSGYRLVADVGAGLGVVAYELLLAALPVLALAAFHRDAPPVRARPWLLALPVGVVLLSAVLLATQWPGPGVVLDWPGTLCVAVVAAIVVNLVRGRPAPWSGTLLVLALAVFGERVVTLLDHLSRDGEPGALAVVGAVQAVVVLVVAVPLALAPLSARGAVRADVPSDDLDHEAHRPGP
ncbi:hypothetical protein [Actinophytocola xanthii]|uniref:Uncharacterized protein n=1 Tax=Actinophytocola xanthii TaxID=1912961 RepID=A0A1Q8C6L3_9PSEU|nr:hypothetical protein [Actinophytocola xanthii]OLF09981.1 hypothetical protein BU204_32075 [Actinophytocola xanthii]